MALIDRIKFDSPSDDAIVWKYPSDEIKLGAQLIVNESQEAVFFKGGKALDIFGPGTHTLASGNLPILTSLVKLAFGDNTPFTAEIWYVNKTAKRNLKWGTQGPIQVIDPIYNYPVSVRAFGQWGLKICNAKSFIVQLIGSQIANNWKGYFGTEKIEEYFSGEIIQRLSDALAKFFVEKGVSIFQASAKINELSSFISQDISQEFQKFGLEIVNFNVERISIPQEEQIKFQEILGKKMEMDQLSQSCLKPGYTTMRTFNILDNAANNEGLNGQLYGVGLGIGAGLQQISNSLQIPQPPQATSLDKDEPMEKLQKLKKMLDAGLITKDDFDKKKSQILDEM